MVGLLPRRFAIGWFMSLAAVLASATATADVLPDVEVSGPAGLTMLHKTDAFGNGGQDALVMFADANSGQTWFTTWGRPVDEYPASLALDDAGSAVVVGSYGFVQQSEYVPTPAFVVKVNQLGYVVWARDLHWSDYSLRLEAVTTVGSDIYATGTAWKYADTPEPGGWFPMIGFVFTVRLDSMGNLVWARRWSSDYYDNLTGKGIVVAGGKVAVVAEYYDRAQSANTALMLWYSAADGTLVKGEYYGAGGDWLLPAGLAASDGGYVVAACTRNGYLAGALATQEISLLYFDTEGRYLFSQEWFHLQDNWAIANGISSLGTEFYVSGQFGGRMQPPEPSDPSRHLYNPLLLRYDGVLPVDEALYLDDMPPHQDGSFTAAAARSAEEVWICGNTRFVGDTRDRVNKYFAGGAAIDMLPAIAVDAWEDESCAASTFEIDNASSSNPPQQSVVGWLMDNDVYVGQIVWTVEPHLPDAHAQADVTMGKAPLIVQLDASGSTIAVGSITDYEWSVFNWTTRQVVPAGSGAITTVTLENAGVYRAVVTVTSDDGSTDEAWVTITVK